MAKIHTPKIHTDCFGFKNSDDDGCRVLKVLQCKNRKCRFYKTKEKYLQDKERYEVADGTLREDGQLTGQLSVHNI